jgi:hypothetical protein
MAIPSVSNAVPMNATDVGAAVTGVDHVIDRPRATRTMISNWAMP